MPVNQAKLQKLQQQGDKARIGGKVRGVVHHSDVVSSYTVLVGVGTDAYWIEGGII